MLDRKIVFQSFSIKKNILSLFTAYEFDNDTVSFF